MQIKLIPVGPLQVNCAVVWGENKEALVIDPGFDAPLITACLDENDLNVAAYLLTHSHTDHINVLAELHAIRPAPVYIHARDYPRAFRRQNRILPRYPAPRRPAAEFVHPEFPDLGNVAAKNSAEPKQKASPEAVGSTVLKISDLSFQCLETPGHTPGGVCYWFEEEKICFTGDTLFKGSRGRVNPFVGDEKDLMRSLKKLAGLPPETRIVPGHGESTTIGYEMQTNPFMKRAAR
ncbi:MAG: MBL fold metallo-hydrolase [Verrucomicrobia bacterium]|nr:MBL fold metallo-hydrolase [Verrucomicrobiota bacterium]